MLDASKTLPLSWHSIYEKTMARIHGQSDAEKELAEKVLLWLMLARGTISTKGLIEALAIDPESAELNPLAMANADTIVSICKGLISVDENSQAVRFAHLTVQEYLQERFKEDLKRSMRTEIYTACLTYLSFSCFSEGPCKDEASLADRKEENAFFSYACRSLLFYIQALDYPEEGALFEKRRNFVTCKSLRESYLQVHFGLSDGYDDQYPG